MLNVSSNGGHMTSPALVSHTCQRKLPSRTVFEWTSPPALLNVMTYRTNGTITTITFAGNNWSEPHNVKFCLHGMYVSPYVTVNSAGH